MGPPYSQFRFQGSSSKHLHVLFKNVPHPIQNLHLIRFLFSHYIYSQTNLTLALNTCSQASLIMSSLALLLLFILSLSLRKETAKFLFDKDLDKVNILETIMAASKPRSNTLEEDQVQQQKVAHDETIICESSGSALTSKKVVIGTEATTYFQMDSPSSPSTKGQRRQSRLMLGPAQQHVEETVNPNERDPREDMADMDYAQPHRKPDQDPLRREGHSTRCCGLRAVTSVD